jgi:hypothetical protein
MASGKITDDDILNAFATGSGEKPTETPVPADFTNGLARELLLHAAWKLNPGPNVPGVVTISDLDIRAFVFGGHQALTKHMATGKFLPFDIYLCLSRGFYPAAVDVEQNLAVPGSADSEE